MAAIHVARSFSYAEELHIAAWDILDPTKMSQPAQQVFLELIARSPYTRINI